MTAKGTVPRDRLKPIGDVSAAIGERAAEYPEDLATQRFGRVADSALPMVPVRAWESRVHTWDPTAFCHRPLYFEDENLERHGRSFGIAQPFVSAAHFTGRFLAWPYLVGAFPSHECQYSLGRETPGSGVTYWLHRPPASIRGALFEAGAISSLAYIVP